MTRSVTDPDTPLISLEGRTVSLLRLMRVHSGQLMVVAVDDMGNRLFMAPVTEFFDGEGYPFNTDGMEEIPNADDR